jgi:hypothetical protein
MYLKNIGQGNVISFKMISRICRIGFGKPKGTLQHMCVPSWREADTSRSHDADSVLCLALINYLTSNWK